MKSLAGFVLVILISAILFFLFLNNFSVNQAVSRLNFALRGLVNSDFSYENFQKLILVQEKFNLLSQIGQNNSPFKNENNLIAVDIYSRYPFNDQAKLVVNAGSADGLRTGLPVLATEGVLLGKIVRTEKHLSEIQTIFDPAWRSTVGIGPQKIQALLKGGLTSSLYLIEPTAEIAEGMAVVNLMPDFPYGLLLGRLANLKKTPAQPWISGELEPLYDLNKLNRVLVVTDHYLINE